MNYDQSKKEIIKLMQRLSPKHGMHNVFRDFTTLAACTISNSVDKNQWKKREDMYMQTIKKYEKEEANKFAEMLALVVTGLGGSRYGDFLGELYMQLEIGNKDVGQFFTPYHVSKLMAQLIDVNPDESGAVTLNEPACGSGGLIIAYAETMIMNNNNFQTQLKVVCNDLDYDVVKMAYIQLSLLGIDAVVMQGDTITQKMNEAWYTPMHMFNKVREQRLKQSEKAFEGMRKAVQLISKQTEFKPRELVQLSLF